MGIKVYVGTNFNDCLLTIQEEIGNINLSSYKASTLDNESFFKVHRDNLLSKNKVEIIYDLSQAHESLLSEIVGSSNIILNKTIIWHFVSLPKRSKLYKLLSSKFKICVLDSKRLKSDKVKVGSGVTVKTTVTPFFDDKYIFKVLDSFFYDRNLSNEMIMITSNNVPYHLFRSIFFKRLMSKICYSYTSDLDITKKYWGYKGYGFTLLKKFLNTMDLSRLCKLYKEADIILNTDIHFLTYEEKLKKLVYKWKIISEGH